MSQTHAVVNVDYFRPILPSGMELTFEKCLEAVAKMATEKTEFKASGDPAIVRRIKLVGKLWEGEFGRFRVNDRPPAGDFKGNVRDIPLAEGEEISEDTAFVYCPRRNVLALQAGRVKVTEKAVADMVTSLNGIELPIIMEPLLRTGAIERLRNSTDDHKIVFKYRDAPSAQSLANAAAEDGAGVGEVSQILKSVGAVDLDIMVSLGRDRDAGKSGKLKRMALSLYQRFIRSGGRVQEMKIYGKDVDGEALVIDLARDRIKTSGEVAKFNGRCTVDGRLNLIREDFDGACKLAGL